MQMSARLKSTVFFTLSLLLAFSFLAVSALITPVSAQTQNLNLSGYAEPEFDPDVPRNQHTFVQSILIEVTSAVFCTVTGIDPIDPSQGCLDINPQTRKLGLAPVSNGQPQIGGLLGFVPPMFSQVYIPAASSVDYVRYLAGNFGIVKPSHAQEYTLNGFQALRPVQAIWTAVRNVSYLLFVVIFILIGLGIMLRVKIDPRTVMTLQNQIPRVIMGILLITFSYAIVGLMIDAMWISTYAGINIITGSGGNATNPNGCTPFVDETGVESAVTLQQRATGRLYNDPLSFANYILENEQRCTIGAEGSSVTAGGNTMVAIQVAGSIGDVVKNLINHAAYGSQGATYNCSWPDFLSTTAKSIAYYSPITWAGSALGFWSAPSIFDNIYNASAPDPAIDPTTKPQTAATGNSCVAYVLASTIGFFATMLAVLIMICVILWTLLRIWFELLKAYVMVILYTITGPLWIIMGLLPGRPLGFGAWFRRIFAHLAVFPATALLLVTASVLLNAFNGAPPDSTFVPPLVGNPNAGAIGYLIAFGILLVTPGLLTILKSSLKAAGKEGLLATNSVTNALAAGASTPKGLGRAAHSRMFAPWDPLHGKQMGVGHQVLGNIFGKRYHTLMNTGGNTQAYKEFLNREGQNPRTSGGQTAGGAGKGGGTP